MANATLETARRIEELLGKVLGIADGTDLIAPNFLVTLKVAQRNSVTRFYSKKDKENNS